MLIRYICYPGKKSPSPRDEDDADISTRLAALPADSGDEKVTSHPFYPPTLYLPSLSPPALSAHSLCPLSPPTLPARSLHLLYLPALPARSTCPLSPPTLSVHSLHLLYLPLRLSTSLSFLSARPPRLVLTLSPRISPCTASLPYLSKNTT